MLYSHGFCCIFDADDDFNGKAGTADKQNRTYRSAHPSGWQRVNSIKCLHAAGRTALRTAANDSSSRERNSIMLPTQ